MRIDQRKLCESTIKNTTSQTPIKIRFFIVLVALHTITGTQPQNLFLFSIICYQFQFVDR
jgi:hypothetical protein